MVCCLMLDPQCFILGASTASPRRCQSNPKGLPSQALRTLGCSCASNSVANLFPFPLLTCAQHAISSTASPSNAPPPNPWSIQDMWHSAISVLHVFLTWIQIQFLAISGQCWIGGVPTKAAAGSWCGCDTSVVSWKLSRPWQWWQTVRNWTGLRLGIEEQAHPW